MKETLAGLSPAYFAVVMATGIVSIAALLQGMPVVAHSLFWLNVALYLTLWTLYLARLARHGGRLLADLGDHNRGVGFFTIVAGTCVLGSQFILVRDDTRVALWLWGLGIVLWLVLTYAVFTLPDRQGRQARPARRAERRLAPVGRRHAIGGGPRQPARPLDLGRGPRGGGVLLPGDVARRRDALRLDHLADLLPLYLLPHHAGEPGGPLLDQHGGDGHLDARRGRPRGQRAAFAPDQGVAPLHQGRHAPVLGDGDLVDSDAAAPGGLAHIYQRFPLAYDPSYWGAVFPLGMYTVCTFRLAGALGLPFLLAIPRVVVYIALAAWLLTAIGLVLNLLRRGRTA